MRDRVRFLLGDEVREVAGVDPMNTVLDWLRGVEGRTGTKEGCNEGDCGACTVVVARPEGDRLHYAALNACIHFVPMLDGAQVLTVEDLADGALHPIQQALVDTHGSQCGFCTPGFVMAIFAHLRGVGGTDLDRINDAIAGNLCRCTGYGPIVEAVRRAAPATASDRFAARESATLARLRALDDGTGLVLSGPEGRRWFAPTSVAELAELALANPDATIVAGATDVGLWVTKQLRELDPVIQIGRIGELRRIEVAADRVTLGAAVPWSAALPVVAERFPDFGELLRRFGSVQVRNAGTVGGNVANGSPIGDSMPALIALGAEVELLKGTRRRTLPLEDLYLGYGQQAREPGEVVEAVTIPIPGPAFFRAYKISKRFDQDISAVCGCFHLALDAGRVQDARIGFGGMAATPTRARACEAAIRGKPWTEATVEAGMAALGRDFQPISDVRASAGYRLQVAQNLLFKAFLETREPDRRVRLAGPDRYAHG